MNPTLSVSEDLNRDPGYTVITIAGLDATVERLSFSIMRHGYDVNYIGQSGWQAAFEWLEPEDAWYENGQLKFVIPPDITWQMDPQGYVFKMNIAPSGGELEIDFFWPDVLPAEAASLPDVVNRLSGTKVKPATHTSVVKDTTVSELVETTPVSWPVNKAVTQASSSRLNDPVNAPEKKPSMRPVTMIGMIIALVVIAGVAYWVLKDDPHTASPSSKAPSVSNAPIEETQPADDFVNAPSEMPPTLESPATTPSLPKQIPVPMEAAPESSQPAPVQSDSISSDSPRSEHQRSTDDLLSETTSEPQDNTPAQVMEIHTKPAPEIVEPNPVESSSNTENALREALGNRADKEQSTEELLKSIEPALREKTRE